MKTFLKNLFLSFITLFVMAVAVRATPSIGLQALSRGISVAKASSSVFNYFRVQKQRSTVNMTWVVANAGDISFFVVQKSTDGVNFDNLGEIFNDGITPMLTYQDNSGLTGNDYYRVVAILYDGNIEYSEVKKIKSGRSGHGGCRP